MNCFAGFLQDFFLASNFFPPRNRASVATSCTWLSWRFTCKENRRHGLPQMTRFLWEWEWTNNNINFHVIIYKCLYISRKIALSFLFASDWFNKTVSVGNEHSFHHHHPSYIISPPFCSWIRNRNPVGASSNSSCKSCWEVFEEHKVIK